MRFYISFGFKYATEAHPSFVSGRLPQMRHAHPDNWIEVDAPTELDARVVVNETLGNNGWSMIYDEDQWEMMGLEGKRDQYFPGECIAVFSTTGRVS